MKLAKRAGLAVGTAVFLVTVSAKASSAAIIKLLSPSTPNSSVQTTFTYGIYYSSANRSGNQENIGAGSTWTFSGSLDAIEAAVTTSNGEVVSPGSGQATYDPGTTFNSVTFGTGNNDVSGVYNSTQPAILFTIVAPADYQLVSEDYSISELYNGYTYTFTGTVEVPIVPGQDDVTNDPSVPEPLPVGGSFVAFGLGWWMKRRQAAAQKIG